MECLDKVVAGPRYHRVCTPQGSPWGVQCFGGRGRNALDSAVSVDLQALPWRFLSRAGLRNLLRGRVGRQFFDLAVVGLVLRRER